MPDAPAPPAIPLDRIVRRLIDMQPETPAVSGFADLCAALIAAGIPLGRVAIFVETLHPQITGMRILWEPGKEILRTGAPYLERDDPAYVLSPPRWVRAHRRPMRVRLDGRPNDIEVPPYQVFDDLKAEGFTDYLAHPYYFLDGSIHLTTWATRAPGGFTDAHVEAIAAVQAPLARVIEIVTLRNRTVTLLETYVGRHAGQQVLAGRIHRGDVEAIDAAIWLSDLRGFTALADTLPPATLIDLLNAYFDIQVDAIDRQGGEVLKFVGDGLLAIFPVGAGGDARAAAAGALEAARVVRRRVAEAALPGLPRDGTPCFGLALHRGTVLYGNIGGGRHSDPVPSDMALAERMESIGRWRLDFTAIGPAVNLAARLESLSRDLRRTVILSEAFAAVAPEALTPLGAYPLRGIAVPVPAFGLPEEQPARS